MEEVLEEVPVALEVVEPVHEGGEGGDREALEGVEEEGEHHLPPGLLLHLGLDTAVTAQWTLHSDPGVDKALQPAFLKPCFIPTSAPSLNSQLLSLLGKSLLNSHWSSPTPSHIS